MGSNLPKAISKWSLVCFFILWGKALLYGKTESISGLFLPSVPSVCSKASHLLPQLWLYFSVLRRARFLGEPVGKCHKEALPGLKVW